MITEFTCGIFTAVLPGNGFRWSLRINNEQIALIDGDGILINWMESPPSLDAHMLIEIVVLMNNIKRQYKQHANTTNA